MLYLDVKKILFIILFSTLFFEYSISEIIVLEDKDKNNEIFTPKKNTLKKLINKNEDSWYGIYVSDNKVGWFNFKSGIFSSVDKKKDKFFKVIEEIFISMNIPGNDGTQFNSQFKIKTTHTYGIKSPYKLLKYDEISSDNEGNNSSKTGILKDNDFYIMIENNNVKNEYIIKNLSQDLNDHLSLDAWSQEKKRNRSDSFISKLFDFDELSYLKLVYTVKDIINTKVNGIDYSYYKINLDEKNTQKNIDLRLNAEYFVDLNGNYLNFKMLDIYDFRIETEKVAKNFDKNNKFFLDLGIPIQPNLPDEVFSKELESISYELKGDGEAIYNGGIQSIKKLSNGNFSINVGSPLVFEKVNKNDIKFYRKNTSMYPTKSDIILNLTEKALENEKSELFKVQKLMNFVSDYINDDYESNTNSVFDIINNKKGDCTEHSLLFTTMARSLGIPTKEVSGWAYDGNNKYVAHAWTEVALKVDDDFYWIPVDPTWNELNPIYHIKASGIKFWTSDLTLFLKKIIFSEGEVLEFN